MDYVNIVMIYIIGVKNVMTILNLQYVVNVKLLNPILKTFIN